MNHTNEQGGGGWVRVMKGTPPEAVRIASSIGASLQTPYEGGILRRLLTSPKMKDVWNELRRRDRQHGRFLHGAIGLDESRYGSKEEMQEAALGELLCFVYCAARDRVSVCKLEEAKAKKAEIEERANNLKKYATEINGSYFGNVQKPASIKDLLESAEFYMTQAQEIRGLNDPLIVKNNRGDPVTRGVQIVVAAFLLERFGDRLDRTAATLTAVALGLKPNEVSERVSRSAFSGQKPRKEALC